MRRCNCVLNRRIDGRATRTSQVRFPFQVAQMVFQRPAKFARSAPEFTHEFAERPRQFRQLFRTKYDQNHDEKDNQMWDAEH